MYSNYVKLALRNMAKNRLYAFINIAGLAIGLAVFLFGSILASYERDHDSMFSKRDQIFTAGSVFSADADIGVLETDSIYTAMAPLLLAEEGGLETAARTVSREFLISLGESNDSYYQPVTFSDKELTRIFDFEFLYGDITALDDPIGIVLSESLAQKFFGRADVVGELLTLDHEHDFRVTGVIENIPADSHFNSSLLQDQGDRIFASLVRLGPIRDDYNFDEDWGNLSMGDMTYMLLPDGKDQRWLADQVNAVYQRHAPEGQVEFIPTLRVRPLVESNTMIWDAMGIPAIDTIRLLGLLVLIIACVNYTNLATAQSLGRAREVGLRKTFGAGQGQLLVQFLVESLTTAALAMLLALAFLELFVPAFNQWSGKLVSLHYLSIAPFLLVTTIAVGVLAGAYPAYLITRSSPIDSLRNSMLKGNRGNLFRSVMIGSQFAISIFMLASVMVMYFQNQEVEKSSNIFPKSNIVILDRVNVDLIRERLPTLRQQLLAIPGVENATFSSQVPFEQSNSTSTVSLIKGDDAAGVAINFIRIDEGFLETYQIPLLAGRTLTRDVANDVRREDFYEVNVLVNELGVKSLGFESAEDALGQSFFSTRDEEDEDPVTQFTIVGFVPDQNFLGLHNKIKPTIFMLSPNWLRTGSVRVQGANLSQTLQEIERVWEEVNPEYPIQQRFLDDVFGEIYVVFQTMNRVLASFALIALSLALIGLFGLAAFMAERRTREIGIRKVLGARVDQIARLLVWQFSIPVLWSLLVAMPAAYAASGLYLNFFADRIMMLPFIIVLASVMGLVAAWLIVAGHAIKIATASPIQSLRYE
ncbi:MAG: FtsX-like permease family protein [Halioglobus sp.]